MSLLNTIRTALGGITANKLRAALTMLGIIIGVASVIAMLALGNGARAAVESSFRSLGSDSVQITARQELKQGEFVPVGKISSYEDGLRMPGAVDPVDSVEMAVHGSGKVRYGRTTLDVGLAGTTAEVLATMDWSKDKPLTADAFLAQGRMFTPAEVLAGSMVCVLGHKTALDLFQGDDPLGQTVWINRQRCLVIGILAELESTDPEERYRNDPNEAFYLPISTAIKNLYEDEPSVTITARVKDESRMDEAKTMIAAYLRKRHNIAPTVNDEGEEVYEDDFNLTTRKDILGAQQEAVRTFSLLLAAMAAVSLMVGGIGIMNVMLVSVTERTREIGVRMAVGARSRDVVFQFLLEAMLLSAVGGIFGIATGILTIPLAATLNQGLALLAPDSIPLAFGVALITGVLFGIYPAMRAARLDPIEALRYE
ncbi:MAG: ABC transporter permease [Chloroflexi bacterium]|nr:ABC transporter permease [Chloroflexota bacterium]